MARPGVRDDRIAAVDRALVHHFAPRFGAPADVSWWHLVAGPSTGRVVGWRVTGPLTDLTLSTLAEAEAFCAALALAERLARRAVERDAEKSCG